MSLANLEDDENKNAKTGHASANVYWKGPQYDTEIPVKHINNISTTLSTHTYIVSNVKIYVKKVFLSVFSIFKNLSKYFNYFTTFKIIIIHIYYPIKMLKRQYIL